MASQTYEEAMKNPQHMEIFALDGSVYEGFYCDPKLDRDTLPAGWHAYDIRHDDDGCGIFVELCHNYVAVNSAGTFFTEKEIPELKEPGSSVDFEIDQEEWEECHKDDDDPDYEPPEMPENKDTDWGYTFC